MKRPLRRTAQSLVAVVTGDVIRSTQLADRAVLPRLLGEAFQALHRAGALVRPFETYRGDGFQGVVEARKGLWTATLIRARLRAYEEKSGTRHGPIDARIAVGIGRVDKPAARVAISDGEAFRLSGRRLDELSRAGDQRLAIALPSEVRERHGEVAVTLLDELLRRFDDIVSSWSVAAAGSVFCVWADDLTQAEAAKRLGITQSAVSQRLRSAHADEAARILAAFERTIADGAEA